MNIPVQSKSMAKCRAKRERKSLARLEQRSDGIENRSKFARANRREKNSKASGHGTRYSSVVNAPRI